MDRVLQGVRFADGLKCIQADVERDKSKAHTEGFKFTDELRGEVETGGRRSRRTAHAGVGRLVACRVCERYMDVWRERQLAVAFEHGVWIIVKLYKPLGRLGVFRQFQRRPDFPPCGPSRLTRAPGLSRCEGRTNDSQRLRISRAQQEQLHLAAGVLTPPKKPRWNHTRVVGNK